MKMTFKDIWIDRVGMAAIVLVSFGYVLFGSSFAQWRLEFSFLNFPVFIGEILLGFSLLLFMIKSARQKQEPGPWGWIVAAYFVFVLLKAFLGYFVWGPLAFRDAALFYYPLFIVIGHSFWSNDLGRDRIRRLFIVLIAAIFILRQFAVFWPCSLMIMGVILALQMKNLQERIVLAGAIFLFAPYNVLFYVLSRTIFLSTLITMIFIGCILFLFLCKDRRARVAAGLLGILVLGVVYFKGTQTDVGKTFVIRDLNVLPAVAPQEPARAKYLFHPVGSSPDKPDTIKRFLGTVTENLLFVKNGSGTQKVCKMENRADTQKKCMLEKKSAVEEKNTAIMYKKTDTIFRYYIWRDMVLEYLRYKPFFGFSFGRPLCSAAILKYFGVASTEYEDGWVGAHNSFLYIIYRAGIVGLAMILTLLFIWCGLARDFYILKDWTGILLCAILINWFVSANFFLIFELPYTAIPIWTILGVTLKHRMLLKKESD